MIYLLSLIALVAIVILIAAVEVVVRRKSNRRKADRAFADRPELTAREFYDTYYQTTEVPFYVVSGVRKVFEAETGIDLSRVVPSDNFQTDLSFLRDDVEDPDLLYALEDEFDIKIRG